uniref:Uncharacterized protein n=1 Tax=Plectus sambesii TaxID=2011161 RepID=A0A914VVK6_9BILA
MCCGEEVRRRKDLVCWHPLVSVGADTGHRFVTDYSSAGDRYRHQRDAFFRRLRRSGQRWPSLTTTRTTTRTTTITTTHSVGSQSVGCISFAIERLSYAAGLERVAVCVIRRSFVRPDVKDETQTPSQRSRRRDSHRHLQADRPIVRPTQTVPRSLSHRHAPSFVRGARRELALSVMPPLLTPHNIAS